MNLPRIGVWLVMAGAALCGRAEERNFWPGRVTDTGTQESSTAAGPFWFDQPTSQGGRVSGFRPFYVQWSSVPHEGGPLNDDIPLIPLAGASGQRTVEEFTVLYPLFYYRDYGTTYDWNVFQLINHYGVKGGRPNAQTEEATFSLFPFYFSRQTGDPATSYRALLPVGGTILDRFYNDRISFVLFPLWVQTENRGAITTSVPWPFVRLTRGTEQGFELWPLYGHRERPGAWSRTFALWPLIFNYTYQGGSDPKNPTLDAPQPSYYRGFLPFYARTDGPAVTSEDYLWPFFGYTDRRYPYHYHETRYFWPFFVQGRGEDHYHNRWGPFYTHSVVKGMDKTWAPWPLYRHAEWQDGDNANSQTILGYFFYWRHEQRKILNPNAPIAAKTHYWPLLSTWDNGAGRRQWQFPSIMAIFFPQNREMMTTWNAFGTLYQHDEQPGGAVRNSLLWNAVTWERNPAVGTREFHLGPLFSYRRDSTGRSSWRVFSLAIAPSRHNLTQTAAR